MSQAESPEMVPQEALETVHRTLKRHGSPYDRDGDV